MFARSKYGGDCAAIELYVFCAPFGLRLQIYTKFFDSVLQNCENHIKCDEFMQFLLSNCSKLEIIDNHGVGSTDHFLR